MDKIEANMKESYIKLKEKVSKADCDDISGLQKICAEADMTTLKLELDYKLNRALTVKEEAGHINEFMYYYGDRLIGYIGICHFGGPDMEVNGMVHPGYRRRGIFKRLFSLVKDEWEKRECRGMLLLSDAGAEAGLSFIRSVQAEYDHSEYEMYLKGDMPGNLSRNSVALRKATNADSMEIMRQNSIYFDLEPGERDAIKPEEEEQCGMMIYMAEAGDKTIGKVHLETSGEVYGIYGLGVLPEYRGLGYGRAILDSAVAIFKGLEPKEIMLQVAATNKKALNLYSSCGFQETSTMDYYRLNKGQSAGITY